MPPPSAGELRDTVYRDGIVGLGHALPTAWADQLLDDFAAVFTEAMSYPGGTVPSGPHRHYLAVHPQRLRGLVDRSTIPG